MSGVVGSSAAPQGRGWWSQVQAHTSRLYQGLGDDWRSSAWGERGASVPHLCSGKASSAFVSHCNGAC